MEPIFLCVDDGDDGQPRMRSSANAHAPTRWRVSSPVAARPEEAV